MKGLIRVHHIDQVMGDPFLFLCRGFGCPDIHVAVNLHGIGTNDLAPECLRQFDGQSGFSVPVGPTRMTT